MLWTRCHQVNADLPEPNLTELFPGDLVLILSQLGRKKRRNVPLLKTLAFYISKHKNILDIKQIADCLYSFNQLSFKV